MGKKDPEKLSQVLGRLMKKSKFKQGKKIQKIRKAWIQVVGEGLSNHTRVTSFRREVLRVEVDNSSILHELSCFQKPGILEELNGREELPTIRDIKFYLGAF